jgi:outer membrane lipoprotein-sorting protein
MKTRNTIACLFLLFVAQVVSAQNNAEAIIRLMVNQMKSHKNVELDYKYQISSEGLTTETQQGKAWLQGEAYKVEMVEQQMFSDGKTIWTYLVDDEEVMVSNATEGEDNTPLKLLTSLDENYAATLTGMDTQGNATIELASTKGQYRRITLRINPNKLAISSMDVYFEDGTKLIVTVDEMKFGQELDDKFFTFDEKNHPNVDVIDMR